MRNHRWGSVILGFLLMPIFIVGRNPSIVFAQSAIKELRLIATNDIHNYLRPLYYRYVDEDRPWGRQSREGNFIVKAGLVGKVGGMAHVATVINRLRASKPGKSLLVDAGDTWHGAAISLFDQGKAMVRIMNAIGYDVMTPGNWDFFYPQEQFLDLVEQAHFDVIAYNLTDKEWEEPVLPQYVIKEVGTLRIALVGMTYPWTALTSSVAGSAQWYKFGIKENEARDLIQEIRENENPDLVIFVSHGGFGIDQKFAQRVDGIDILVSGHTHDEIFHPVVWNHTIIFQAGAHGKYVANLDLRIQNKKVVDFDYRLIMVNQKSIPADPQIAQIVEAAYAPYQKKLDEVIGTTDSMLYRRDYWQSTLGNLITTALIDFAKTDIVFFPAWRYGATLLPGKITVEDVYNIIPTDGHIITYSMRGQEIKTLLENILRSFTDPAPYARVGGDMIRFAGMQLRYDLKRPPGDQITSIRIAGKPMLLEEYYRIASVNTRFQNNPLFGAIYVKDTGTVFAEVLIQYIRNHSPLSVSLDDRIQSES